MRSPKASQSQRRDGSPGASRSVLRCVVAGFWLLGAGAVVAEDTDAIAAVNARVHRQLEGSSSQKRIETVSGQLYISQENIDAGVVRDALAALLEGRSGPSETVAIQRAPRLNFEIHFEKNSADLTRESRASLDQLAQVLAEDYAELRFMVGGHTDQDGDEIVNQPLSQARADSARRYLVREHSISPDRLVARGFGSSEPLRQVESSPQDKLYNRRVDLRPLR